MTDDELRAEVERVLAHMSGAEVELSNRGQALAAGAVASGRYLVLAMAGRLFPAKETPAEPEKPADGPP